MTKPEFTLDDADAVERVLRAGFMWEIFPDDGPTRLNAVWRKILAHLPPEPIGEDLED